MSAIGPRIGVAVLNWNGRDDSIACLESLIAADPGPDRTVVVDNGSTDDSVVAISAWIGQHGAFRAQLIVSQENRGFAAGNNVALTRLAADDRITHFLLLNNDATVDRSFFADLRQALAEVPDAGVLGVTIFDASPRGKGRVWYAGGVVDRLRVLGRHRYDVPHDGRPVPVEFVTGCAMLISREALARVGPLPECYFIYFEDLEYCVRASAAGLRVLYAPRPVVHHAITGTVRAATAARVERRFAKSRALFARRNLRGATRATAIAYLVATGLARAVLRTLRGRPVRAWAAFRGTLDGLLSVQSQRNAGRGSASPGEGAGERVIVE